MKCRNVVKDTGLDLGWHPLAESPWINIPSSNTNEVLVFYITTPGLYYMKDMPGIAHGDEIYATLIKPEHLGLKWIGNINKTTIKRVSAGN